MINKKKEKQKGFTIIELAISSAILAVIFGGMTIFGIQVLKGQSRSRAINDTVGNASYAIESINKTIRTSNNIDPDSAIGSDEIFIIDNNTGNSYCYKFDSGDKILKRKVGDGTESKCDQISGSFSDIVGGGDIEVTGYFDIKETERKSTPVTRGFVRTRINIEYKSGVHDNFDDDKIVIQSSVSLRDYGYNN